MPTGDAVARVAREALLAGPMGNLNRGADYEAFLESTFGQGKQLRSVATSCAIFAGACLIKSGALPRRGWPRARAITTWVGLGGFSSPAWVPVADLVVQPGDILYWCGGNERTWKAATNGHVGIALEGEGWLWKTAEGGGSPGGTMCRMSAEPKDIRSSSGRPLRGAWRPQEPAPTTWRRGDRGPEVARLQAIVGAKADGIYGPMTEAAVRAWERGEGLLDDGVWGLDNEERAR